MTGIRTFNSLRRPEGRRAFARTVEDLIRKEFPEARDLHRARGAMAKADIHVCFHDGSGSHEVYIGNPKWSTPFYRRNGMMNRAVRNETPDAFLAALPGYIRAA